MIDLKKIESLASSIISTLPQDGVKMHGEIKTNIESVLAAAFSRMNLVTREEFDAQTAVLQRTRMKLESLEAEIARLEKT